MKQALADSVITVPAAEARAKVAEYRQAVKDRHEAEDIAILRGYRAIANGHKVIDLPHVIGLGGTFDNGLPKLAIATASHDFVHATRESDGRITFHPQLSWGSYLERRVKDVYRCPAGTLPAAETMDWRRWRGDMRAMVPHVPPALRPVHKLDGYAVLFEVDEWKRAPRPPGDPALLKHIGGDLYAVLAVWDLTPLEQSVLMGRIRAT